MRADDIGEATPGAMDPRSSLPRRPQALRSARPRLRIRPREVGVHPTCGFAELPEVGAQPLETRSELRVAAAEVFPRVAQSDAPARSQLVGPSARRSGPAWRRAAGLCARSARTSWPLPTAPRRECPRSSRRWPGTRRSRSPATRPVREIHSDGLGPASGEEPEVREEAQRELDCVSALRKACHGERAPRPVAPVRAPAACRQGRGTGAGSAHSGSRSLDPPARPSCAGRSWCNRGARACESPRAR
jgi:hypothetical protein